GDVSPGRDGLALSWTLDSTRVALLVQPARRLSAPLRESWAGLARGTVDAHFASARAQSRFEGLRKSERLRQALYEIADLSGASLDMQEMLARIPVIVGPALPSWALYALRS